MIDPWYKPSWQGAHVCPTVAHPSWTLQQCPRCEGIGSVLGPSTDRARIADPEECPFCFGVGVVKVGWWTGQPEAIEPPKEPYWHEEKRTAPRGAGERED